MGVAALAVDASAQTFTSATTQIPQGNPNNNSFTESVNFFDLNFDGYLDSVHADGGDCCNDQSRIWMNNTPSPGFFQDQTTTRFPAILQDSRDIEFVDIDNDGDQDLYISNTSAISSQTNRWWVNTSGTGNYTDETAARWVNIAGPGSSISNGTKLIAGGFIDWSCFCAFADLDNDGDMDLFHSTYGGVFGGQVPSRVFLNDGAGFYEEFNPGGCQLSTNTITNGTCGIWCEGTHQHNTTDTTGAFCDIADTPLGVELGDIDGDFDVDILQGARNEKPRLYINRLSETGTLAFRDETFARFPANHAPGGGHYEQEFGDLDLDGDLDIYGLNWNNLTDYYFKNNGDGTFAAPQIAPGSSADDNEPEFFDFDLDGDLDVFVANFSGQDKLYRNSGPPGWTLSLVAGSLPGDNTVSLAAAAGDVDDDGDQDLMVAEDQGAADRLLRNNLNTVDTHAPYYNKIEQAPTRNPSATPTVVRALIYDNESFYMTAYDQTHTLEYSVNGGAFQSNPVMWAGGNVFRGEIDGTLVGDISYRFRSVDRHGNTGVSITKRYVAANGCTGNTTIYCTAKFNSQGCLPQISYTGVPTASATGNFHVTATNLINNKTGLFFYSLVGPNAAAFQGGFLCVKLPTKRMPLQSSGGNPPPNDCSGSFDQNFDTYVLSAVDPALIANANVWLQGWARDPASPSTTSLTDALSFTLCP